MALLPNHCAWGQEGRERKGRGGDGGGEGREGEGSQKAPWRWGGWGGVFWPAQRLESLHGHGHGHGGKEAGTTWGQGQFACLFASY